MSARGSSAGSMTLATPSCAAASSPAALCMPSFGPANTRISGATARAAAMKPQSSAMTASTPASQALRTKSAAAAISESATSVSSSAYTRQPRTRQ